MDSFVRDLEQQRNLNAPEVECDANIGLKGALSGSNDFKKAGRGLF